ncbi:MAG: hypothetical protein IJY27_03815 [Clostridia bacterium]|nr:hypothetical protein [Clostridia bacterium]
MATSVLCRDVYLAALALLAQSEADHESDYAERAPYLLAAVCCEAGDIDAVWREREGLDVQPSFSSVCIELDTEFPLSERFVPLAAAYVAAMLVLYENETLSDTLYERYCDMMSELCSSIPGVSETITDIYGFNY